MIKHQNGTNGAGFATFASAGHVSVAFGHIIRHNIFFYTLNYVYFELRLFPCFTKTSLTTREVEFLIKMHFFSIILNCLIIPCVVITHGFIIKRFYHKRRTHT